MHILHVDIDTVDSPGLRVCANILPLRNESEIYGLGNRNLYGLIISQESFLPEALHHQSPSCRTLKKGATHDYYRYPASAYSLS